MAGYEDFIDMNYKPDSHDVIASFRVKVPKWSSAKGRGAQLPQKALLAHGARWLQ